MTTVTFEELSIEFSDPSSIGSYLIQAVLFLIGLALTLVGLLGVLGIFQGLASINGTAITGIFFILGAGLLLINVGLTRHKTNKKRFIKLSDERISGCMTVSKPKKDGITTPNETLRNTLEAPNYCTFDLTWSEIEGFEEGLKDLTIFLKNTQKKSFSLADLSYADRKKMLEMMQSKIN